MPYLLMLLTTPMARAQQQQSNCTVVSNLSACPLVDYSAAISSPPSALNQKVERIFQAFNFSLYQYDCGNWRSPTYYSPVRQCGDCELAYRRWLCASTFPRCSTSQTILKPCRSLCWEVVQSCPSFLEFQCPTDETVDASYGPSEACNAIALTSSGRRHVVTYSLIATFATALVIFLSQMY